jgi:hypothetical protein
MSRSKSKSKKKKTLEDLYDQNGNWKDEKRMVIGAIRRLFRQSQFKEVSEASRVEIPKYNKDGSLSKKPSVKKTCQVCGELFSSTNIAIDHVEPMVPLHLTDNDLDYIEVVRNIICRVENLQRICNPKKGKKNTVKFLEFCHQKKTHKENFFRKKYQEYFEKNGVTDRKNKDQHCDLFGADLESKWEDLYYVELKQKLEEMAAKEERKKIREQKKLEKNKAKNEK